MQIKVVNINPRYDYALLRHNQKCKTRGKVKAIAQTIVNQMLIEISCQ